MRILAIAVSAVVMLVSIVGIVVSLIASAFSGDHDAYGEVPIPGTGTVSLPAGDVIISFNAQTTGSTEGGLPLPDLEVTIKAPAGVDEPVLTKDIGGTTTVNNDSRRRVWVAQIQESGDYLVRTDGDVDAFVNPQLAFGARGSLSYWVWIFVGLFVVSVAALITTIVLAVRARRTAKLSAPPGGAAYPPSPYGGYSRPSSSPAQPFPPTNDSIKAAQLKTLTDLHASGALTDQQFETERRRLLGG